MQKREWAVKIVFKKGEEIEPGIYKAVYSHLEVVKVGEDIIKKARKRAYPCIFTREVAEDLKAVVNPHNPKQPSYKFGKNEDGSNFIILAGPQGYNGGPLFEFLED